MYCSKCGTRCPEDALYCHRCGALLCRDYPETTEEEALPETEPEETVTEEVTAETEAEITEEAAEEEFTEEAEPEEIPEETEPEENPEEPEPEAAPLPNRAGKKSLWIALGILLGMIIVGSLCHFLLPDYTEGSAPLDAAMPWFTVDSSGALVFLPENYSGGSVLTVPESVGGIVVTALADRCFADADSLVTVELPDTLKKIGSEAFTGCTSLRGIALPEKVEYIGSCAFYGCSALEAVSFPGSLAYIAPDAMDNCPKLLYVFYMGTRQAWAELYHSYITPYTQVMCTDGIISQPVS